MIKKMKKLKKILLRGREALDTGAERWGETMTWGPMTDAQQRRADRIAAAARITAEKNEKWRGDRRPAAAIPPRERAARGWVVDLRAAMAEVAALHCAVFAANTEVSVMRNRATRAEEDAASLRSELQTSHEQLERARRTITDLARRADVLVVERDKAIDAVQTALCDAIDLRKELREDGDRRQMAAVELDAFGLRNALMASEIEVLSLRAELRPYRDVCGGIRTTPTSALSGGSHGRGPLYKSPSAGPVWTHRRHND